MDIIELLKTIPQEQEIEIRECGWYEPVYKGERKNVSMTDVSCLLDVKELYTEKNRLVIVTKWGAGNEKQSIWFDKCWI